MARIRGLVIVALLCCMGAGAQGQTPTPTASVDCVQQLTGGLCSTWIRNIPSFTRGNYLTVGGFFAQNDDGGGLFVAGNDGSCSPRTATSTSGTTKGSPTVVLDSSGPVAAGMSIVSSTSNAILSYDIITAVSGSTITLETPAAKTVSSVTLTISNDNGGSVIADAETVRGPSTRNHRSAQGSTCANRF